MTHLRVTPGSVSPFGLIHDAARHVRVVLDRDLKSADRISFHPNINTATLVMALRRFPALPRRVWESGSIRICFGRGLVAG